MNERIYLNGTSISGFVGAVQGTARGGGSLGACPDIRPDGIYLEGQRVIRLGLQGDTWGDKPISEVRSEGEGPIYRTPDGVVMLAPGRYTYSNVYSTEEAYLLGLVVKLEPFPKQVVDAFPNWLAAFRAFVDVLRKAEETGTYTGETIFIDYEFQVKEPVPWASNLRGLPTWLPSGVDMIEDYWGRGYRAPKYTLPGVSDLISPIRNPLTWIGVTAVVAVVGAGLLVYYVPRRKPAV